MAQPVISDLALRTRFSILNKHLADGGQCQKDQGRCEHRRWDNRMQPQEPG